jgi:glutamate dehydrogenase
VASSPELTESSGADFELRDNERLKVFAEKLFAHEPRERVERTPLDRRLALIGSAFEFFFVRTQPITVRVLPGPSEGVTVIESAMADCPFIIDSLLEYFRELDAHVAMMLHPVYRVARDEEGRIVSLEQASATERYESFVHAELELLYTAEDADRIEKELRSIAADVHVATADFDTMTARALRICEETAARRELIEVRDFLRWMVQGGFVFLGYRRYRAGGADGAGKITTEYGSELGILREREEPGPRRPGSLTTLTAARRKLFFDGPPLVISKSRVPSQVHRRRSMDSIAIRRGDPTGGVAVFDHFVGLFTSKAYAEEAQHIPLLRAKLREVVESEQAMAGSHDYKELVATFNSFPKDELFRASVPELLDQIHVILDLENENTVRLKTQTDILRGNVVALVVMPREVFSTEVRVRIQHALTEGLNGTLVYYYVVLGEGYTARIHFCFRDDPPKLSKIRELESQVARLARRWEDRLAELLTEKFRPKRGRDVMTRWAGAFEGEYKAVTTAHRALADIERLEDLLSTGRNFTVEVCRTDEASDELRMLGVGDPPGLSELMPVLQNFGVVVLSEDFHIFRPKLGCGAVYVQAFSVRGSEGHALDELPGTGLVGEAIAAVRNGLADDDALNSLVLSAGLRWREVALLRAYLAAAFQMRLAPARPTLRRVLVAYPHLARAMFHLFAARLDPGRESSVEEIAALRAGYLEKVAAIDNITDDRTARTFLSMVEATVRTNFFQEMPAPDPYIALKFESGKIANLSDTPPLYEIHVNSPRMEGCHLRAGRVARGGIRFSDRLDDYRTEILDLMKTQTVKNAIIVPTGSKGGFVVKRHAAEGPPGVEAYQTLIRAMLDLTDNATDDAVVHPPRVKVLDSDGPYLVVAADKGTAGFSDIANRISIERGFWLGDAFASGGEHGFDHKKMGITARGAWESARRHLREMGRDPDRGTPLTVIGIGDMSGDVFGNGMLRSCNLKLIAAFDHRHVFIDPDPDPAASFAERKRLYEKPRSQWSDYDPALMSAGGGVWPRSQKRIALSPEVREALGCTEEALDGESLVRAILRAPADMLYNGGIGTYVRAADESDEEVGDHANDGCRIVAGELRVRVVVEGGNLGFTQKARIEYALAGGRINTDAIDNSAGVDTSDHEVNLKILLDRAVAGGAITADGRNRILAGLPEEVAAHVLRDNHDQALLLSLEQVRSRSHLTAFRDHMQMVQERGALSRYEKALPGEEVLRERRSRYAGLTRPELALVTAYTKIDLVRRLEGSPMIGDPYLIGRYLIPYFPPSIAERFGSGIGDHRLRDELIATRVVNELVDLMGSTFAFGVARDHGVDSWQAVRSWLIAAEILCVHEAAEEFKRDAGVLSMGGEGDLESIFALERACASATNWAVRNVEPGAPIGPSIEIYKAPFARLAEEFEEHLAGGERERFEAIYRSLHHTVAEGESAHRLARLTFADHVLNVLEISRSRAMEPAEVAATYFGLAATLDFAPLEQAIASVGDEDRWERRAAQELADELRNARVALCVGLLEERKAPPEAMRVLQEKRALEFADVARMLSEIGAMTTITMPAMHVAIRSISRLAGTR